MITIIKQRENVKSCKLNFNLYARAVARRRSTVPRENLKWYRESNSWHRRWKHNRTVPVCQTLSNFDRAEIGGPNGSCLSNGSPNRWVGWGNILKKKTFEWMGWFSRAFALAFLKRKC